MPAHPYRFFLPGLLVLLCVSLAQAGPLEVERMGQWPMSTLVTQQIDGEKLAALDAAFRAGEHGHVDSFLVIRNGHIVFDKRYEPDYAAANAAFDAPSHMYNYRDERWHPWYHGNRELHSLQSVSKSVLAVLYGVAKQQGKLPPVDTPALALLEDRQFDDPDGRKAQITLEDLLTMRGGIEWDEDSYDYTDPRNTCAQMEASDDWVQYVLDQPMAADPGSTWVYNSGITMVLTEILEALIGQTVDAYTEAELFGPLGIEAYFLKRTPSGLGDMEGGLYLAPHDMAKIMQLMINDGTWNGRQLMSPGWAAQSTQPAVLHTYPDDTGSPSWADVGYGYQWWEFARTLQMDTAVYTGIGYGGQYPVAVPEFNLIVVLTGWRVYDEPTYILSFMRDGLLPAVK